MSQLKWMLFKCTGVKVSSISPLNLVWMCVLEICLNGFYMCLSGFSSMTLQTLVFVSTILVSYGGVSGRHPSPWPCFLPKVNPLHSIILVSLFFNYHARPLGPAGPDNLRYSSWKIGSVDQMRSSQAAQCSCIHDRWKIHLLSQVFIHSYLHYSWALQSVLPWGLS